MIYTVYGEEFWGNVYRDFENKEDAYKCYREFVESNDFLYCELAIDDNVLESHEV